MQEIRLSNSHFFGLTNSVLIEGSAVPDPTSRIVDTNCTYSSGTGGETAATRIPTIASAATMGLPFGDVFIVTGSAAVSTINGGWTGRRIEIYAQGAMTFALGGNLVRAFAPASGQLVPMRFDGSAWHY